MKQISSQMSIQKTVLSTLALSVLLLSSCSKQKTKDQMTSEQLSQKAQTNIEQKKYSDAASFLEELIMRFPDHAYITQYKLALAELYSKQKKYAPAQNLYENFTQFYPSDQKVEYAKYKSILSMFYQTLQTDCDQTSTDKTIKLCEDYLKKNSFKKYRKEIIDIQNTCENRLIDKEIYVFNFYLRQGRLVSPSERSKYYEAARNRLKHLQTKYMAKQPQLEARLLFLEGKLAQKEKDKKLVNQKIKTLTEKFPESPFTQMAQNLSTRKSFIF